MKNSIFVDSKAFLFGKILDLISVVTEKMLVKRIEMWKKKDQKSQTLNILKILMHWEEKVFFKQIFWYDCHLFLKLKCHHNFFMILFQVLHISTLFSNQSIFDHLKPAVFCFFFFCFISLGTGWLRVVVQLF